jgi:hypothetical protein
MSVVPGLFAIWPIVTVIVALLTASEAKPQTPPYQMIHEGKHWTWYARQDQFRRYRTQIAGYYNYADNTGGGFAAGDIGEIHTITGKPAPGIGCAYDAFINVANGIKGYWAYVFITHEMVNMFSGDVVSGGWPVDWWADDRSPFPMMTAIEIEYEFVPPVAAYHDVLQARKDRLVVMFRQPRPHRKASNN